MKTRLLLAASASAALLLLSAACGSTSSKTVSNGADLARTPENLTVTPAPAKTPTSPPPEFGTAPVLGGNITKITPEHASKVTQLSTRSPNQTRPGGVCADVNFKDLPENAQWFRMVLDDTEVTTKLTWIVASRENPLDGKVCYAPAEGLAAGRHTAAMAVQDPRNTGSTTRQIVAWAFEVTP